LLCIVCCTAFFGMILLHSDCMPCPLQSSKSDTNCQWQAIIYKVPQSAVGSVVDVIYV
jgi:hypothetical protein